MSNYIIDRAEINVAHIFLTYKLLTSYMLNRKIRNLREMGLIAIDIYREIGIESNLVFDEALMIGQLKAGA